MKYSLVGIGEILWDLLPEGMQLGGAPSNFAYFAHALGEEGIVVSAVGNDELGNRILEKLNILQINYDFISKDEEKKTGTVSVLLDDEGVPEFAIHEDVAWDAIPQSPGLVSLAKRTDAVCFGTLAQRSDITRKTMAHFLDHISSKALCIFDINLRQHFYSKEVIKYSLERANVIKLNQRELFVIAKLFNLIGDERTLLRNLSDRFKLSIAALTLGAHGSILYSKGQFSTHAGYEVEVIDTVGAGDAFTASMAIGILKEYELDTINDLSNRVASYVCTQMGATPKIPGGMKALFGIPNSSQES